MIRRTEIDKKGRVSLEIGDSNRWYDVSAVPPLALAPEKDDAIALSGIVRKQRLEVISYRPHRRLVATGKHDGADAVFKGYRSGRVLDLAEKYRTASAALHDGGTDAVKVLFVDSENDFLVMREENGRRPGVSASEAGDFRAIGAGIRQLQSFRDAPAALETFGRDRELGVLDERTRRLRLAGGAPPERWQELRDRLQDTTSLPRESEMVPAHRDLHDGQCLVGRDRPCLLDFDLLCLAESELDPANFLAHLELRRMQHPESVTGSDVKICAEAFLDGMGLPGDPESRMRLTFYEAATYARLALVYQLRPQWQGLVPNLVALGMERLDSIAGGPE